ncbi:hypothetical protein QYS48_28865 [Marivirga arenosa]|uniref:Uncharacterized protein n=1 Tax=Marivirga arenosa TaxID=3059076 RepID=A0AA51N7F2_9BACT|nr:hypothetical protein [Marivirga sp. ABR2-2]WMN07473.1 hypothetical protein QYS48_28865 [Marivirga sp. ABR2-2]
MIKGSISLISSSIIILSTFFLTSISWFKWAKYNIKSIEVGENEITIVFCQFDTRIETTCMVDEVLFEMRSRYKSKGYWAIFCNDNLILRQEASYWDSNLDLLELHEEFKKYLPDGNVVTI